MAARSQRAWIRSFAARRDRRSVDDAAGASVAPRTFEAPAFGSFVKTSDGSRTTYGVVSHVEHASIDPSRRAIPLGRSWDELEREQPQVLELLTTEFEAICVAFAESDSEVCAYLPPLPPRVHDFVDACEPKEIVELTEDLSFVRTLGGVRPARGRRARRRVDPRRRLRTARRPRVPRPGRTRGRRPLPPGLRAGERDHPPHPRRRAQAGEGRSDEPAPEPTSTPSPPALHGASTSAA